MRRDFETRYWFGQYRTKPESRGFPKKEDGSIVGASKAIGRGLASMVQCVDRNSGKVIWTIKRGKKVPGVAVYPTIVVRGDGHE